MKPGLAGRTDWAVAILLVVAFALAGWKVRNRSSAAEYVSPAAAWLPHVSHRPKTLDATARSQLTDGGKPQYDAKFVSAAPGQAVHAASLVELQDGRLRAVWFSGSREGAGDVTIQTAVLDTKGLQWNAESTLFDRLQVEHGLLRYVKKLGNPVIARAPDGTLILWFVTVSIGGWAGSSITWSRSVDDGTSWAAPQRLVTSPFLNISTLVKAKPVALTNGQIALPVYHEFAQKFAEILRLDLQGRVVDKIRIPGSQKSLQPVVLPESTRQASVYMRSAGAPVVMTSATADAGATWSAATASSLPNPDAALAGLITDRGTTWLALNPTAAGRATLALLHGKNGRFDSAPAWTLESPVGTQAGLSRYDYERLLGGELKAGGVSDQQLQDYVASATRQLCNNDRCSQEFSYPYLLQSRDGDIHLVYTWHRTRIKHIRFDPLQGAKLETPDARHGPVVK